MDDPLSEHQLNEAIDDLENEGYHGSADAVRWAQNRLRELREKVSKLEQELYG